MIKFSKQVLFILLFVLTARSGFAQTSIQVTLGTSTVTILWDYAATEESRIDDFQVQRTYIDLTAVPAGPFPATINVPKTSRSYVFTIPSGVVVGARGYFRVISRKAGQADSQPSATVSLEIIAPPQPLAAPTNIRIQ